MVTLFPMSMATINLEGFSVSFVSILETKPPCFFSISRYILFEETNAISIPEKKALSIRHKKITLISMN